MGRPGYATTKLALPKIGEVKVFAGGRVASALAELTVDADLYHGVRLMQVLEAVYEQGRKDGRAEIASLVEGGLASAKKKLGWGRPGRPRGRRRG
jgi:hypothetical protein